MKVMKEKTDLRDRVARMEADYERIEEIANASDEEIAERLAAGGLDIEESRARMRALLAERGAGSVRPLRRRAMVTAMLVAAALATLAGGGVALVASGDRGEDDDKVAKPAPSGDRSGAEKDAEFDGSR
jgi:hypothetical protein